MDIKLFLLDIAQTMALIVTVVIMIRQTKRNTKTTEASQYQNAMQLMFEWRTDVQNDADLVKHYKEVDYFNKIFKEYGVEFYFHNLKLFSTLEMFFMLNSKKIIDENMMRSWENNAKILMQPLKNRKLWNDLHKINIYNEDFSKWMDKIVERSTPEKIENK